MNKLVIFAVLLCALAALVAGNSCPLSSQMTNCSPKCKDDSACSNGAKCCPNICNTKSCVQANKYNTGSGSGYKGSSSGATGTYCGNTKCNSYEKCDFDKTTKRQKCVRT